MFDNPIENIMAQTLNNLKNLVDVNTVIGKPMKIDNSPISIIPISKLSMGFLVGGGEYNDKTKSSSYPYAGGSGAGVSVTPIGFLLCDGDSHQLIRISDNTKLDDLISVISDVIKK